MILVESNLGRLEIKIYVVGMEYLDINTSVGGSLLEMYGRSVGMF